MTNACLRAHVAHETPIDRCSRVMSRLLISTHPTSVISAPFGGLERRVRFTRVMDSLHDRVYAPWFPALN